MSNGSNSILEGAVVRNGELILTSNISTERVKALSNELYNAFVNYEIPHWRVVACTITDNGKVPESVIGKIDGINMSYIELMNALSNIVISERHGDFYSPDVDGVESVTEDVPEAEKYAHAMISQQRGLVTTSNGGVRFFGEPNTKVRCLTRDVSICNCKGNNVQIFMYLEYGSGIYNYEDNDYKFRRCRNIVPCRTVFDLTKDVLVKPYVAGDKSVKFMYLRDVDEEVLSEILRGYNVIV